MRSRIRCFVQLIFILFEMGILSIESSDQMITFNGAIFESNVLDCSKSPTAFAQISKTQDIETENGFTISLWYRQDESQYESSSNEISYLFSSGALPGGTLKSTFAIAIPGHGLASEGHLRVYMSNNRNEGEYDFVDTNVPPPSNIWQHIVVVIRPNVWPRHTQLSTRVGSFVFTEGKQGQSQRISCGSRSESQISNPPTNIYT